ncbi:type 2 lanthipeptide synthetase LanM family protein [Neobacillus sp. LXY-4]|uniref:type 2 lanthipeptide synthetase LanM family protein n=1 Tax=Neobacillus sp. LXY-4 TaxID=3379826 RepID=UPI003EDFCEA4
MVIKSSATNLNNWNNALYLTERKIDPSVPEKDGEKQIIQWCNRAGLAPELLHFRLKEDGLDYAAFKKILGGSSKPFEYREKEWFRTLEEMFSLENLLTEEDVQRIEHSQSPFYPFMVPFINWAKKQMLDQCSIWKSKQSKLPFNISGLIPVLMKAVHQHVHLLSGRMLVYELNVARLNEQLKGNSAAARFDYFICENLNRKQNMYQILQKYPTLTRLLTEGTRNLVDSFLESLSRFLDDYPTITQTFQGDFCELFDIDTMEGDRHNNGRSVMIFHFTSGTRLVYKPRPLSTDLHFQQFLCWINDRGANPKFNTIKILSRSEYGWEEWVEHKECETDDQINRFYQRMGGYLAVLYLLYATDFHLENVLANGEHPFLIDVEALFQNVVPLEGNEGSALQFAAQKLNQSILRTGMLPVSLFKSGEFRGLEVSAIGGRGGQELPRTVYRYEHIRTDQMKLVKTKAFLKGSRNRPTLNGKEVRAEAYVDEIIEGFRQVYKLFIDNRELLMAKEGPLLAFADDPVRALVRHTYNYATFLDASLHPNYLQDSLHRTQLFDFLWRAVEHQPSLVRLVSSETADMLNGDIPMFINKVNSTDLWDVRGKKIPGFYRTSALALVLERLRGLSGEDCETQIHFLRMSMTTIAEKKPIAAKTFLQASPQMPKRLASRNQLIEASVKIGDRLLSEAIWGKDKNDVCWIGLSADESEQLMFTPMDDSLYDGVLGMALYFTYLARESGEQRFNQAARAAVKGAYSFWELDMSMPSVSAFKGWASAAYVLSHLGVLWKEPELITEAERLLKKAEQFIEKDTLYDLMAGSAGVILVALRIYSLTGNKEALTTAKKAGNHLLAKARNLEKGIGWAFEQEGCVPIGGLAHGAAGFSWALIELSKISGDEKYLEAALQSLTFERSLFDPETGNWKDVRPDEFRFSTGTSAIKWCHGAAGIAMGRIMSFRLYPDDRIRDEITIALNTTLQHGLGGSHCLCHGDLGNIEAMLLAGEVLEQEAWKRKGLVCGTRVLKEAENSGWICGIPQGLPTPGLMTGLAGIGYGLLRLANPEAIPSILTLAGPQPEEKGENRHG